MKIRQSVVVLLAAAVVASAYTTQAASDGLERNLRALGDEDEKAGQDNKLGQWQHGGKGKDHDSKDDSKDSKDDSKEKPCHGNKPGQWQHGGKGKDHDSKDDSKDSKDDSKEKPCHGNKPGQWQRGGKGKDHDSKDDSKDSKDDKHRPGGWKAAPVWGDCTRGEKCKDSVCVRHSAYYSQCTPWNLPSGALCGQKNEANYWFFDHCPKDEKCVRVGVDYRCKKRSRPGHDGGKYDDDDKKNDDDDKHGRGPHQGDQGGKKGDDDKKNDDDKHGKPGQN